MANKEIRIPYNKISNPQTITQVQEKIYKENNLNVHMNDVLKIDDDDLKRERVIKVKGRAKTFSIGDVPWHNK